MDFDKELLKGNTNLLILKILEKTPMYGYQIIKELTIQSNNTFNFKEGTIYPILHLLEQKQYIESFWEDTLSKRKRKYYKITNKGLKALEQKEKEWIAFSKGMSAILNGGVL